MFERSVTFNLNVVSVRLCRSEILLLSSVIHIFLKITFFFYYNIRPHNRT